MDTTIPDNPREFDPDKIGPGTLICGRYTIERRLGEGGFGVTFLARNNTEVRFVLKFIKPKVFDIQDRGAQPFWRREVASLVELGNKNPPDSIVKVVEYIDGPERCLVCHFVEGVSLHDRIREIESPKIPTRELLDGAERIAEALCFLERHGYVHNDVRASNIIWNGGDRAVLIDFGLSAPASEYSILRVKNGSPEQRAGIKTDIRSDVYCLGIALCRAVGVGMSADASPESFHAALEGNLKKQRIPKPLSRLLLNMVRPEPKGRPESARRLLKDIKACRAKICRPRQWPRWVAALILLATGASVSSYLMIPPKLAVSVRALKDRYRIGEDLIVECEATRPCFLYIYHLGSDARFEQLFPNADIPDSSVPKNTTIRIPRKEALYRLQVRPPVGSEKIVAFARTTAFSPDWKPPLDQSGEIEKDELNGIASGEFHYKVVGRQETPPPRVR